MTTTATRTATSHPTIAPRDAWLDQRKRLLEQEKDLTHRKDAVNARRRRLPMVALDKNYVFQGPDGEIRLLDLFAGRRQLIVYHFMFDPEWDKGCMGCTGFVQALGDLSMLGERDTSFALISRAPLAKLLAQKQRMGWTLPWVSSHGSDFNYDFHVTLDASVAPVEYNYVPGPPEPHILSGEAHGISVFFRLDDRVFHTYSAYARGVESLTDAYSLLDLTPFGRQEDFEDSPEGWPQRPTYG